MSKSLKEIGLNGIAIDMLLNPYRYIVHDMPSKYEGGFDWGLPWMHMCCWKGLNTDFLSFIEIVPELSQ